MSCQTRRSTRRSCCATAPVRQILQERRKALVQVRQHAVHRLEVLLMRVPPFVIDGDVRHALLHQPPRDQAGLPEFALSVAFAQFGLFLRQIKHFSGIAQNQLIGRLSRLLGRFQGRIAVHRRRQRVQLLQQLAPILLPLVGDARHHNAFDGEPRIWLDSRRWQTACICSPETPLPRTAPAVASSRHKAESALRYPTS